MTPGRARLARAIHLTAERRDDGTWRIVGGSAEHIVSSDGSECDCHDSLYRPGVVCKHRSLVLLRLGNPDVIAALREIVPQRPGEAAVAMIATQKSESRHHHART